MENLPSWPEPLIRATVLGLGLIIGSFLNVVVARLPKNQSLVRPPSHCPKCKKPIAWYQNVPVLSYLYLRGRCGGCSNPISIRYPIIEMLTGLLFLATYLKFGLTPLLIFRDWPFVSILVAVTFIDLEHRIIPDKLSLGGLVLGLLTGWMTPGLGWMASFGGAALGFGIFYGFAWLYFRSTGRSGLGGGDIKLLAMLGAFLGPLGVITTILISSIAGSVIGIGWALASKEKSVMRVAIPYGPFLILGALYYYLLGDILWLPFTTPI